MSYGAIIAVQAAAAQQRALERIIDAFRLQDATSVERARPLAELGIPMSDGALAEYIRAGVIRGIDTRGRPAVIGHEDAKIGAYYLDESAYIEHRDRKASGSSGARKAMVWLAIALLLILFPLLFLVVAR